MYLEIINLTKTYKKIKVVENFCLQINMGELISILGPSGCGKTTTLQMIGGFIQPDSGKIILNGKDITDFPPNQRPTSTVFQSYALFPHMSVFENIRFGLKCKGIKKTNTHTKVLEMLDVVGLIEFHHKYISQLSGGQRQRVALARALVVNPDILLLDEPLSNLDANLRVKMRAEIKDLQKKIGITTLFVTHDQEEALSISDRIVVMKDGKIAQTGSPDMVYRTPETLFTAGFIGKINRFKHNGSVRDILIRPENIRIHSHDNGASKKGIIKNKQFMGPYTTYLIESGEGMIHADVRETSDTGWAEGDTIYYHYPEETIIKIKEKASM